MKMFSLVSIYFRNLFGIDKLKYERDNSKRVKAVVFTVFMSFIAVMVFVQMFSYIILGSMYGDGKYEDLVAAIVYIFVTFFVFILFFPRVKSVVFDFKDYDMVMALPISKTQVVMSRYLIMYLTSIFFTSFVTLPLCIVRFIRHGFSVLGLVSDVVVYLCTPLLSLTLAIILGTIVAIISSYFKKGNTINLVLNIVFFIAVMLACTKLTSFSSEEQLEEAIVTPMTKLCEVLWIPNIYAGTFSENVIDLLIFAAISIIPFILIAMITGCFFKSLHTRISTTKTNSNYKVTKDKTKQSNVIVALYKKEMARYFGSTIYVINTMCGLILMTMFAIALVAVPDKNLKDIISIGDNTNLLDLYVPLVFTMFVLMSNTTGSSISLEGYQLWILKSLPIRAKDIFISKILVNLTIDIPAIIVSVVFYGIKIKGDIALISLGLIIPMIAALLSAVFGIFANLKYPKFDWTSDVQVVKQSASSMISMMGGMFFGIVCMGVIAAINILVPGVSNILLLGLSGLFMLIVTLLLILYLNKCGDKEFAKLQ